MFEDDDYDGVQYDTFYAPSAQQLEAEQIRRECYALDVDDRGGVTVTWWWQR